MIGTNQWLHYSPAFGNTPKNFPRFNDFLKIKLALYVKVLRCVSQIFQTSISVRLVTLGSKSRLTVVYGSFVPRHQSVGGSPGEPTEVLLMFSHIVVVFM